MRIVFMGSPDFAVNPLALLYESKHQIAGVVTQPDRPGGRGLKARFTPVKEFAIKAKLPILQTCDLKDELFIHALKMWKADCFVIVGFCILPVCVYTLPPLGAVNLHASLLPQYRGAAPIQWAIMNGETKTGLTTFLLKEKVDTGDMLFQNTIHIRPDENFGELHNRMAVKGAKLLLKTLNEIEKGSIKPLPQKDKPSFAPKITKKHRVINWDKEAISIKNHIRGLSPAPCAVSWIDDKQLKIYKCSILDQKLTNHFRPGTIIIDDRCRILVMTKDCPIIIEEMQIQGKRKMSAAEFLMGSRLETGISFNTFSHER